MSREVWLMFLLDGTSGMHWWVMCFIISLSPFFLSANETNDPLPLSFEQCYHFNFTFFSFFYFEVFVMHLLVS